MSDAGAPVSTTMQIFRSIREANLAGPTALTIGNFDGLHRGHQALLRQVAAVAAALPGGAGRAGLLTFSPHPLSVLRPDFPHQVLTTPEERVALAGEMGADFGVIEPFTLELAALEPRVFMELVQRHLGLAALVVGPDFALGRNRAGDIDTLRALGGEMGFTVNAIEPEEWQGKPVRSSIIRHCLMAGDVAEAADLLGRSYRVPGIVQPGDSRGRTIGTPTANVAADPDRLLPADGVYATYTVLLDSAGPEVYLSVTNLGVRPTVDGLHHRVETHLLDFPPPGRSGDLYGRPIAIDFVARLRGEKRFENLDALVAQIRADIAEARRILRQPDAL